MKILNESEKKVRCKCGKLLEYDEGDIHWDNVSSRHYIECPNCYVIIFIEAEAESKYPTINNFEFPQDFTYYSDASADNKTVNQYIKFGIMHLVNNRSETTWYIALDNVFIFIKKEAKGYEIVVSTTYMELFLDN